MFPFGMLPIEFAEFRNGGVESHLSQYVFPRLLRREASLGALRSLLILGDGFLNLRS